MEPLLVDLVDVHAQATRTIAGVGPDQWSLSTPCEGWSVADLVRHQVVGHRVFTALLEDEVVERPATLERWDAELRERETPELITMFAQSARNLERAFELPGAMAKTIRLPFGEIDGEGALHLRLAEAMVHGWDLSQATGRQTFFENHMVEREIEVSRRLLERLPPGYPAFGTPSTAPEGAAPLDRLAALLGRTSR